MISQYAVKLAKQSIQLAGWPDLKQLVLVCVYYNQLGSNQSCQKTQQTAVSTILLLTDNVSLNMLFTQGKFLQDSKLVVQLSLKLIES